ncbi:hypothetical protein ACFOWM_08940 [Ferruginibacter yonginensis]|uniref:Uncharacterized protein n=1 Tax=Ferruginibacter yonginensis TaxID=1310416 RepID=A0ABV8QRS0_9BACT
MQHRINPDIDIIAQVIAAVLTAKPDDGFCKSIQQQYFERGSLSKKQLEGLLGKAQRIQKIAPAKIATLEAIIKKKHVTQRSEATISASIVTAKDEQVGQMVAAILLKYPQHKRVLLFQSIFKKNNILNPAEKAELERLYKLLIK